LVYVKLSRWPHGKTTVVLGDSNAVGTPYASMTGLFGGHWHCSPSPTGEKSKVLLQEQQLN
jgi:hypothetical protein